MFEMCGNKLCLKILCLKDKLYAVLVVDKYEDNIKILICNLTKARVIELRNELYVMVYMSHNSRLIFNGRKVVL
jgi:hypothetical protein